MIEFIAGLYVLGMVFMMGGNICAQAYEDGRFNPNEAIVRGLMWPYHAVVAIRG